MKRLRVDETSKDNSGPQINNLYRSALPNATPTISYTNSGSIVNEGMQSSLYPPTPPVNYAAMPTAATPHSGKPQAMQPLSMGGAHSQLRGRGTSSPNAPVQMSQQQQPSPSSGSSNFPRLKVEDALSYLDLVKLKFGNQPQVYNDFLDIMKEFKSQSIDTPGVIQRVSVLFRGFPDLIVGFNTFLPPGYKIEVQRNDSGYAFQVSVSVPSPTGTMVLDPQQQQKPAMLFSGSGTIIHNNMSSQGPPTCLTSSQSLPLPSHTSQQPQAPPPSATVLHNLSTYGSSTPIHNNTTHNALTMSAAVSQALGHAESPQNQPVEFNHAINYVNKIKNRFQGQPEKYKRFLEILHTYQKEQRTLKESSTSGGPGKHLTEQEVYSQVAKLFENQSDLLAEFGQFLPDATSHTSPPPLSEHVPSIIKKIPTKQPYRDHIMERNPPTHKPGHLTTQVKRSPPYPSIMHRDAPPAKKHKLSSSCRDVTTAEASKYGTLNDYAFFDKVRKALRSTEVYYNFLRCLHLYNQEIVSKSELVQLVTPFLGKYPEMLKWFKEFLGQSENEPISYNVARAERPIGEHAIDIDLTTAKRLGASYCIIPPTQEPIKCSGRTQLCKDILNDQWVSFPTWSEDSTFVSSRKTQYEEYMYRCEDERFELDVVIETNAATIRVLEGVQKRFSRMSSDEVSRFRLDDCLGGNSPVLHQRALKRIYGDKAQDIIEGLKRSPAVAVPVVLRRLKAKEEEWREAQKGFNKIWREQNEKFYLKSLDHQGINFKQNDTKAIKPKNIVNEIETLFDERNEQNEEEATEPITGPHMVIPYKDKTILDDAANLLIHHVKRQTGIQKGEKRRIKHILRQFVPDLFFHPRQQLSDDEREDDDEKDIGNESPNSNSSGGGDVKPKIEGVSPLKSPPRLSDGETSDSKMFIEMDIKEEGGGGDKTPTHAQTNDMEEAYTLFMASINWYSFLRLHAILCERLAKMYERALVLAREEVKDRGVRKETTAVALRLKTKSQIEVEDFYPAFLDMVKNLLDGNMDSNTYEDTLREMFGIHAYIAFTLDKVVQYAVRQLQSCVTERTAITVMELFQKEHKRGGAGGLCVSARKRAHLEFAHQRVAENTLQSDHCFKICIYKRDSKMTIELLDTVSEDPKKPDEARNWSTYTERYADCSANNDNNKLSRSPVYLNRNLRNSTSSKDRIKREDDEENESNGHGSKREDGKRLDQLNGPEEESNHESNSKEGDSSIDALEKKLHSRPLPQRNQSEHPGYDVSDETQCKIDGTNSKIRYTVNKDSYLYKDRAFRNAKLSHPSVTKRLGIRFRSWLKRWTSANVSDTQQKQCIDWLMGRSEGVVPNRTRVVTNNDVTRSPYSPFNRYRVERLNEDVV